MIGLVEFLRARLDEDGQAARAAMWDDDQSAVWTARPPQASYEQYIVADYCDDGVVVVTPENADADSVGEHIARHDPARVLAEVDAKRRILDEFVTSQNERDEEYDETFGLTDWEFEPTALPLLRLLALPYADHPDYRDEWRP
ncbi:DUF6221 family protein [Streptomyces thermolilacinus]|uniref:DUF6221 family protein n=1 Tax=Streptomyces thermolilacinus TaxID=285540 RepID=UPI0033F82B95